MKLVGVIAGATDLLSNAARYRRPSSHASQDGCACVVKCAVVHSKKRGEWPKAWRGALMKQENPTLVKGKAKRRGRVSIVLSGCGVEGARALPAGALF